MRNRTATSDRSAELQPVAPAALNSHALFYGGFELPLVPPKVEAVVYRGDKTREIDCEDCVICLGSFEEGDECWLLKDCNHAYHKNCIEKWLPRCWNCPLCRCAIIRA
ncbi:hypothetical protein NL676_002290 [Syzygium grande]|nr:hypothetical protein NL676_002290 [Syzygium grande]